MESYKSLDPDLSGYIVSFAFGDIYSRTSLTQQEQTLVTISTLVALGTEPQLKLHINTGFNVQCPGVGITLRFNGESTDKQEHAMTNERR